MYAILLSEMNKPEKRKQKIKNNKPLKHKKNSLPVPKNIIKDVDFPPLESPIVKETTVSENAFVPKVKTIQIPFSLQEVFDFVNQVEGYHYLVGSMVLRLLLEESKNTIEPSDLDYLSLHSKSDDWIKNGHFMQVTEEKHLFKLTSWCEFKPILPLEVWLEDEKSNLTDCLLARDFTVCALACTSEGIIIDPTGYGFEDLENRRLRMIGVPEGRFQQSPSILLRVIKYMMLGFTPDASIIKAMLAWQPTEDTNKAQLHALCGKIFAGCDKLVFADLLLQYKLLSKLFDKPTLTSKEDAVLFLENKLLNKTLKHKNSFFLTKKSTVSELQKTEELSTSLSNSS